MRGRPDDQAVSQQASLAQDCATIKAQVGNPSPDERRPQLGDLLPGDLCASHFRDAISPSAHPWEARERISQPVQGLWGIVVENMGFAVTSSLGKFWPSRDDGRQGTRVDNLGVACRLERNKQDRRAAKAASRTLTLFKMKVAQMILKPLGAVPE